MPVLPMTDAYLLAAPPDPVPDGVVAVAHLDAMAELDDYRDGVARAHDRTLAFERIMLAGVGIGMLGLVTTLLVQSVRIHVAPGSPPGVWAYASQLLFVLSAAVTAVGALGYGVQVGRRIRAVPPIQLITDEPLLDDMPGTAPASDLASLRASTQRPSVPRGHVPVRPSMSPRSTMSPPSRGPCDRGSRACHNGPCE